MRIITIIIILGLTWVQTSTDGVYHYVAGKGFQEWLSVNKSLDKQIDLKTAQITHTDGTPIKFTLSAFNYNPLGTTGGYVNGMTEELVVAYNNPDNTIPRIKLTTLVHELVHISTLHFGIIKMKCRQNILDSECQEKFAYDAQHLLEQVLELEKQGWLIIEK